MSSSNQDLNIPPICPDNEVHLFMQHNPLITEKVVLFRDPDEYEDHYKFKDNLFTISKSGKRDEFNPQVKMFTIDSEGKKHRFISHINLLRYPTMEEYSKGMKLYDVNRIPSKYKLQPLGLKTVDELYCKTVKGLTLRQFEQLLIQVAVYQLANLNVTASDGLKPTFDTTNSRLQLRVRLKEIYEDWKWLYGSFFNKVRPVHRHLIDPNNVMKPKELVGLFFGIMTSPYFSKFKGLDITVSFKDGSFAGAIDASQAYTQLYPIIQYAKEYSSALDRLSDLQKEFEDEEIEIEDVED